jgi:sigma-B regulation protein RsbU (phosphoserine phosphatase)
MTQVEMVAGLPGDGGESPPEFYCAEVWGGNRPIDAAVELTGMHGWIYSQPCDGGRGGDIHYTSICGHGLLSRLCLADVAGHGEAIANVSQETHRLLRRYMNTLDQRRVLRELNRRLLRAAVPTMTTAVVASYFPPLGQLSVSYAGHPLAWLGRRGTAAWVPLVPPARAGRRAGLVDLPLAIAPETRFTRWRACVRPGDRLLLVTDGVLEAPAPTGALFGEERLGTLLNAAPQAGVRDLVHAIVGALRDYTGRRRLAHDDVTLMALEITPGPRGLGVWHGLKRRFCRRPQRRAAGRPPAGTGADAAERGFVGIEGVLE